MSVVQPAQSTDASPEDSSSVKESPPDTQRAGSGDDTKLHAARFHRTETEWDELLGQVCSSLERKKKINVRWSVLAMMIARVPPYLSLSSSFFPSLVVYVLT